MLVLIQLNTSPTHFPKNLPSLLPFHHPHLPFKPPTLIHATTGVEEFQPEGGKRANGGGGWGEWRRKVNSGTTTGEIL